MDPGSVIAALNLGDKASTKHPGSVAGKPAGKGVIADIKPQGFVILGSLLSFDANMSKELINDLIDVSLLSQLAASASCDRLKDAKNWYTEYSKYMNMLGWNTHELNFTLYKSHEKVFEISTAVTDRAKEIAAHDKEMLATIDKIFEVVKKADSKTLELLHSKSTGNEDGNFQIGTCSEDKSGTVTMAAVNGYFTTKEKIKDFLFSKFENTKINMFMSASSLTFNKGQYARVQKEVQKKLGDAAKDDVRKLPDFTQT